MTDRELLELAAKAAGYKQYYSHWLGRDSFVTYEEEVYSEIKERRVVAEKTMDWNPLTDDGDALRLAVTLNLNVHIDCQALPPSIIVENNTSQDPKYIYAEEKAGTLGTDLNLRLAATRRAIVRAAAKIWRDKE